MAKFIEVDSLYFGYQIINVDKIENVYFDKERNETYICFTGDEAFIPVKDSYEQLRAMLIGGDDE